MSLRRKYLRALKKEFPQHAPIFPKSEILELGEFGIYQNARFIPFGNIFEALNLNVSDYKDQTNAIASEIILSENAWQSKISGDTGVSGSEIEIKIGFESRKSYALQLFEYTTEGIILKNDLRQLLKEKKRKIGWRDNFRIVYKRLLCEKLKFAYSSSSEGELMIGGKLSSSLNVNEIDFVLKSYSKVNANSWIDSGKATPIVDFVQFHPYTHNFEIKSINRNFSDFSKSSLAKANTAPDMIYLNNIDLEFDLEFES